MLIHSVVPIDAILPPTQMDSCEYLPFDGGIMQGSNTTDGFRISRLISTDPSLYLKYNPGDLYDMRQSNAAVCRRT